MNVSSVGYHLPETNKIVGMSTYEDHRSIYVPSVESISKVVVDIISMLECTRLGALLSAKYANEFARHKRI